MYRSPNVTIRNILDGPFSRDPIISFTAPYKAAGRRKCSRPRRRGGFQMFGLLRFASALATFDRALAAANSAWSSASVAVGPGAPAPASERRERGVQRRTRPHRRRCLGGIGQVVTADIDRLALRGDQFGIY